MRDRKQQSKINNIKLVTDIKHKKVRDIEDRSLIETNEENKRKVIIIIRVRNDKTPNRDEKITYRN